MSSIVLRTALKNFIPVIGVTFAVQAIGATIFVPQEEDRFYDFFGCIGFATSTITSLYAPALRAKFIEKTLTTSLPSILSFHPRQLILSAMIGLWTTRLGSLLLPRALKAGGDSRFEEIKKSPVSFSFAWTAQAAWILLTGLPVYLINCIPKTVHPALGIRDFVGIAIWIAGISLESIADNQKSKWRKEKNEKKHEEKFISSGLWAYSRHPNQASEIVLWTGVAVAASSLLGNAAAGLPRWSILLALASPALEYCLIRFVSGVPPLEASADKKFKDDAAYQRYKKSVPVFFPWA